MARMMFYAASRADLIQVGSHYFCSANTDMKLAPSPVQLDRMSQLFSRCHLENVLG